MTRRPGTVLFAVLFLIVLASLSAVAMLGAADAERAASSRQLDDLQLHAAVRSAMLVYAAELDAQRDALMRGGSPDLPATIEIPRGESEPPILITLLPAPDGRLVTSEAERLDLNSATAEMLVALPGISPAAADLLVAERETSLYASPNRAAQSLAGEVEPTPDDGPFSATGIGPEAPPNPLDLLTVFSADPQTQIGVPDQQFAGTARVSLAGVWSDQTERAFQNNTSEQVAQTATSIFINAPRLTKPSEFVKLLIAESVPTDQWAGLLDACTFTADPYVLGLVDINRAARPVLAALPGLDDTAAAELIDARERLAVEDRLAVTWPLDQGIIPAEAFVLLVDHITTRSLQWRLSFRVSVSQEFDPTDPTADAQLALDPFDVDLVGEADEFGVPLDESSAGVESERAEPGPVFEAVFDAAGGNARIAYLREITAAPLIEQLLAAGLIGDRADDDDLYADEEYLDDPFGFDGVTDDPGAQPMTLDDLAASFFDEADDSSDPFGSFSSDDSASDDLAAAPLSFFGDDDAEAADDGDAGSPEPATATDTPPQSDNRLGRWKPIPKGGRP